MRSLIRLFKQVYHHRSMILAMAWQEIQKRYIGTFAGFLWSILNPLVMILVYWFVFSVGFRVQPTGGIPFIALFCCGLLPWLILNDTLMANTNVIIANSHLVKKIVFPTEILPIINLVASLVTHGIMLVILLILLLFNGISLSLYNFQFLYYFAGLLVFTLGMSWLFAALNVFFRDIGQALIILLNVWFWVTPIVWMKDMIPPQYQIFLKINPMFYIVDGYKASFAYHTPFWENYKLGIYFWAVSIFVFFLGGYVFKKLKPEFADVI